jgi:ubiquinone/menaquinone biosynthesis C-methylase UbiE
MSAIIPNPDHDAPWTKCSVDYLVGAANRPQIQSLKQRSYDLMQIEAGSRVIDIGCGPGVDTIELAGRVGPQGHVIGIDADPRMVAAANAAATKAGLGERVQHFVASSLSLPFVKGRFDACRCDRVLQHLSRRDG